jgi:gamma-glutamyl:cysteine ligase YbdK (ATP-grasp superfamily)
MRLHQGTVWSWNRPVYDPADGGHLRIELRALPSGPTITDMLANTAFIVGLAYGLVPEIESLTEGFDFADAEANFYRAAQGGLDAWLVWPDGAAGVTAADDRIRAADLAIQLVELARRGLHAQGVEPADADPLLEVITARAQSGQTGAVWQRRMLALIEPGRPSEAALAQLVQRYVLLSAEGTPVHTWPVEK